MSKKIKQNIKYSSKLIRDEAKNLKSKQINDCLFCKSLNLNFRVRVYPFDKDLINVQEMKIK